MHQRVLLEQALQGQDDDAMSEQQEDATEELVLDSKVSEKAISTPGDIMDEVILKDEGAEITRGGKPVLCHGIFDEDVEESAQIKITGSKNDESKAHQKKKKHRSRSPRKRSRSPRKRSRSPRKRSRSPRKRSRSPRKRSRSPRKRSRSPRNRSHYSPQTRRASSPRQHSRSRSPARDSHRRPQSTHRSNAHLPSMKPVPPRYFVRKF